MSKNAMEWEEWRQNLVGDASWEDVAGYRAAFHAASDAEKRAMLGARDSVVVGHDFNPFDLVGKRVRLNNGKVVVVRAACPFWALVSLGRGISVGLKEWVDLTTSRPVPCVLEE